jgi:hypothetical protein
MQLNPLMPEATDSATLVCLNLQWWRAVNARNAYHDALLQLLLNRYPPRTPGVLW